MKPIRYEATVERLARWDYSVTRTLNRTLRWRAVCPFFTMISKLGNGRLWYSLMIILPILHGAYGLMASLHMGITALVTLAVYKSIKGMTQRPRPGAVHEAIEQGTAALDEYSFPSGHTMHSVMFTLIGSAWFPAVCVPLGIFTILVAASRIVLGLHYPTDVILGAILGALIGFISLSLVPI